MKYQTVKIITYLDHILIRPDNLVMKDISGKTILAFRERLSLNQRDLAAKLGVTQGLISQVEGGRLPVSKKMLRAIWSLSDEGVFEISFDEFLRHGGVNTEFLKAEFGAVAPIPVETWKSRIDLREPPNAAIKDSVWIPGMTNSMRVFRFDEAPPILAPSSLAVFRPVDYSELTSEHIVLLQTRPRPGVKHLESRIGHVGRAIVTRRARMLTCQFERSPIAGPIVDVAEKSIEVLMICHFRGRYGSF